MKITLSLLGLNGAGKSTTFKILIGEIEATSGKGFINGYDIKKNRYDALRNLGFCPQFDILPEYLTVIQAFELIARLRGIKKESRKIIIDSFTNVFKLNEFNDKLVQDLSGGNKRKLSSALAFIGKSVVFLGFY
jgi:ATP-binding cassette subfamily A (ABC1) protein 3